MTIVTIYRGDTPVVTAVIKDEDGVVVDLTAATMTMSVKEDIDATNYLFQNVGSLSNPTVGEVKFLLTTTDTEQTPGTYIYDIQYVKSGEIKTVQKDKFTILADVTRP